MKQRTYGLPVLLTCSILMPLAAEAAPDANRKPASPPSASPPSASPPATAAAAPATAAAKPSIPPQTRQAQTSAAALARPAVDVPAPPPGAARAPGSATTIKSAKLPGPKTAIEAAQQQVVMLERAGRPIAVGTLLSGDGRIVSALSPLTHGNQIDAHYPEGQIVHVRLTHSDRAWDLALLTPEGEPRHAGLKASRDPAPGAGTKLHAIGYVKDKQLGATDLTVKAKTTLRGADSVELPDVLELPFAVKAVDVGGPLVNDQGEVVAIIARACAATDKVGCTLTPYAAPVSAIRDFLRRAPMRRGPWLGVEVVAFDAGMARGVRVAAVSADSPAASAGLHAGPPGVGDVVLAVNGAPVPSAEAFASAVESHSSSSGAALRLTVFSEGRYHELEVLPRDTGAGATPRRDRVFQSNPALSEPRPPMPNGVPNPYR